MTDTSGLCHAGFRDVSRFHEERLVSKLTTDGNVQVLCTNHHEIPYQNDNSQGRRVFLRYMASYKSRLNQLFLQCWPRLGVRRSGTVQLKMLRALHLADLSEKTRCRPSLPESCQTRREAHNFERSSLNSANPWLQAASRRRRYSGGLCVDHAG